MMDSAYFVGRGELLQWINSTLGMNVSKIEECASGAIACQLMDVVHPGVVPMSKVNFAAKSEYEYINNYKLLQNVFNKMNVSKHIEVGKLVKARPLDNLEFMQWLKAYFDSVATGRNVSEYDPTSRRSAAKGGAIANQKKPSPAAVAGTGGGAATAKKVAPTSAATALAGGARSARSGGVTPRGGPAVSAQQTVEINELTGQVTHLKLNIENIEKERDFYFSKLRDCEILCQMAEFKDLPVVQAIVGILYATDESVDVLQIAQSAAEKMESKGSLPLGNVLRDSNLALSPLASELKPMQRSMSSELAHEDQENLVAS